MAKHPFEQAAEGLEAEAAKPRNKRYRNAYLLTAAHLRSQAKEILVFVDESGKAVGTLDAASLT